MHAAAYYSRTIGRVFAEGGDKNSTDSWSESTRIISNRAGIPWNEEAVRFAFIDTFVVQPIITTVAFVSREGGKTLGGLFTFVRAFKRDTRTNSISDRSYHFCIARQRRKSWMRKAIWRFRPTTLKILRAREFYSLLSLRGISRSTRFPGKNNFPSARVSNINTN